MANVKLSDYLGQSIVNIKKALDQEINAPWHYLADSEFTSGSPQAVTALTEYAFECDGLTMNSTNLPAHITKLWDTDTNKCYLEEILPKSIYVARVQLTFTPSTAAEGYMEFKAYIDDPSPKLIQTIRVAYKTLESRMEALFAFYVGEETGYNMLINGLKFTYTPKTNGAIHDRGILIYKT